MSENGKARGRSKDELCEKLRDLIVEKQQVKEQIIELEKQIKNLQENANQAG